IRRADNVVLVRRDAASVGRQSADRKSAVRPTGLWLVDTVLAPISQAPVRGEGPTGLGDVRPIRRADNVVLVRRDAASIGRQSADRKALRPTGFGRCLSGWRSPSG